jgi:DNA-binding transcriptional ArsR family regulator
LVLKALGALAERNELCILADLVKSMADETRLTILSMLQDGEMCVCELMEALPVSQPAVSHHLRILRQAGLITDQFKSHERQHPPNSLHTIPPLNN